MFLVLLSLGLGWLVYKQAQPHAWQRPSNVPAQATAIAVAVPKPLPDFVQPPLDDFAETAGRPLFMPTRRPPEPEDVETPSAPTPSLPLKVNILGVIISETERFALVQRERETESLRLAENDEIDGWKVASVLADRVVFRRDEEVIEIELRDRAPAPPKRRRRRDGAGTGTQETPKRGQRPAPSGPARRRAQPSNGQSGAKNGAAPNSTTSR